MPAFAISASRNGGTCTAEFFHDINIRPGQRTITTTFFPSDEHVRDFGVQPLSRHRSCLFCTASKLREFDRIGLLGSISGLTVADLVAAGIVTDEDIAAVASDTRAIAEDWRAVLADLR